MQTIKKIIAVLAAAALTKSQLFLKNARMDLMESALPPFLMSQIKVEQQPFGVMVDACAAFLAGTMTEGPLEELIDALGSAFGLMLGMTGSCALLLLISITSSVSVVVT